MIRCLPIPFLFLLLLASCGPSGSSSHTSGTFSQNRIGISLGTDPACNYVDEPCVTVKICLPSSSTCQNVGGVLLDTGSYGLRIFSSALTFRLPNISGGSPLGECAFFGTDTSFGPVDSADVVLGGEPAVTVPIQVIDATYSGQTSNNNPCGTTVATSPSSSGFNGILGVGLFTYDCGSYCVNNASNGAYFSCSGASCSGTTASLNQQVQNPVPLLPVDNNGVVVSLPSIPPSGQATASGTLTLGIGTEDDNVPPSGIVIYEANSSANGQEDILP